MDQTSKEKIDIPPEEPLKEKPAENTETDWYSVIVSSISSLVFGMNLSSYASLEDIFKEGNVNALSGLSFSMSPTKWALSQSILNIGALVANIYIGFICLGAKHLLILNNLQFIIGYLILLFGNSTFYKIFARFVIGMGLGVVSSVTPGYLNKIATKENKGLVSTCHQLFVMIGVLTGNVISYFCSTVSLWKVSIYIQMAIVVGHFVASFFTVPVLESENQESFGIKSLFKNASARKSIYIAFALHIGQQLSGVNGIIFESNTILAEKSNPRLYSMIVGVAAILGVAVTMVVIDRFGRKVLLLISTLGISLSLFTISTEKYKVACLFSFIILFSFGMGPIPWFITNEIFEPGYVKAINMISIPTNWFTSFLVTQNMGLMMGYLGFKVFALFGACMVLLFGFVILCFKETKGRSPEFQ